MCRWSAPTTIPKKPKTRWSRRATRRVLESPPIIPEATSGSGPSHGGCWKRAERAPVCSCAGRGPGLSAKVFRGPLQRPLLGARTHSSSPPRKPCGRVWSPGEEAEKAYISCLASRTCNQETSCLFKNYSFEQISRNRDRAI